LFIADESDDSPVAIRPSWAGLGGEKFSGTNRLVGNNKSALAMLLII
jgi:hypothetical protein